LSKTWNRGHVTGLELKPPVRGEEGEIQLVGKAGKAQPGGAGMRNLLAACAIGVTACLTTFPVRADFVDGTTLMEWAREYKKVRAGTGDALSQIYVRRFQVYVLGVHDAYAGRYNAAFADAMFCSPKGATVRQISEVVYWFLQNNPELGYEPGSVLVANALTEAFPCEE